MDCEETAITTGKRCESQAKVFLEGVHFCPRHDPNGTTKNPGKKKAKRIQAHPKSVGLICYFQATPSGFIEISHGYYPDKHIKALSKVSNDFVRLVATERGSADQLFEFQQPFEEFWREADWFYPAPALVDHIKTLNGNKL